MFSAKYFLLMVLVTIDILRANGDNNVKNAMEENEIVPDIIDVAPKEIFHVMYGSVKANLGNELTPTSVKDIPTVQWNADTTAFYLLSMLDPDAPSRDNPVGRAALHWLVGNIPANKTDEGNTITAYIGSGPGKGSGLHRYVFLVYQQPGKVEYEEEFVSNSTLNGRLSFSMKKFANKYKLGNPIAGNFYQAQYDDYVPQLYQQLNFKMQVR